jgi:hypothetical protein
MANIIFINATESPFNYNRTLDIKSDAIRKNLSLGIRSELLYAKGVDLVEMRLYLIMKYEKEQVFSYNVGLTFTIAGWKEKLSSGATNVDIQNSEEVSKMLDITVGFIRGSLFVQEKSTPFEGMNLPILSIPDMISTIQLIDLSAIKK